MGKRYETGDGADGDDEDEDHGGGQGGHIGADRALAYYDQAGEAGADLLFFPEIQFSPFFPQYENRDAS